MSLSEDLKHSLEEIYDVPFEVKSGIKENEPWFEVAPAKNRETLFTLLMLFRNEIRLVMEMLPQKYSANMVRAMGEANKEKKVAFAAFSSTMKKDGAKIDFSINENTYDPSHPETWPVDWNRISLRITVMPVKMTEGDIPDYKNEISKWGIPFTGMILSLLDIVPLDVADEIDSQTDFFLSGHEEGRKVQFLSNRYERNPINRYICLKNKGYICSACGFDFEKQYGNIGKGFIHVHHILPVSKMGEGYVVDPINDLVPVCPNCHAMLHSSNPPLTIDELKIKITETRSEK